MCTLLAVSQLQKDLFSQLDSTSARQDFSYTVLQLNGTSNMEYQTEGVILCVEGSSEITVVILDFRFLLLTLGS